MSAKLVNKEDDMTVCACDMKNGQLGVIVEWPFKSFIGVVVQAYENQLIPIGYADAWDNRSNLKFDCRVRLLRPNETIVVIDNNGEEEFN